MNKIEKIKFISTLIIAIAIIISANIISNTFVKAKKFERSVVVKGLAEKQVAADLAVWPIQLIVANDNLALIQTTLETQKQQVKKFFQKYGFTDSEIYIGVTNIMDTKVTSNYNVNKIPVRYVAKIEVTVRTNAINKMQGVLLHTSDLLSQGILLESKNTWGEQIEYRFTQLNTIKVAMIKAATKNAKKIAEEFAEDSKSSVGKIKSASQGVFSIENIDNNTPQLKTVRVVTTVEYFLED